MHVNNLKKNDSPLNVFKLTRIARNLTVKDVAAQLEVTPAYINAIEKGEKFPSSRLLRCYSRVLNVPADVLLTFEPVDTSKSMAFEKTLLRLLRLICPSEIDEL